MSTAVQVAGIVLGWFCVSGLTAFSGTWYVWQWSRQQWPKDYDNKNYDRRDQPHLGDCLIGMILGLVWPLSLPVMVGNQLFRRVYNRNRTRWEAAEVARKEAEERQKEIDKIAKEIHEGVRVDDKHDRKKR